MPLSICELFHISIFDNELFIWVKHFYFPFHLVKVNNIDFSFILYVQLFHIVKLFHSFYLQDLPHILLGAIINWRFNLRLVLWFISAHQLYPGYSKCTWHYIMNTQIVEFDCYLCERTVPILPSFIKNQMSVSKILFPYFVSIFVQNNKTPKRDRMWK